MPRGPRLPLPLAVDRAQRDVGRHLGDWRRLQNLTAAQVADRAGIAASTLSRIEQGGGGTFENMLRVARALGVLDRVVDAFDPALTDLGRLRSRDTLPQRVRHRSGDQP